MKKALLIAVIILMTTFLAGCGKLYSEEDIRAIEHQAYEEGFEYGYDLRDYELKGEMESEMEKIRDEAYESGFETGYDVGYEDAICGSDVDGEGENYGYIIK